MEAGHPRKRRKRKNFLSNARKYGKKGKFGRGSQLSEDVYNYFLRVLETCKSEMTLEEKSLFANNVFEQTVGEEKSYSCNQVASRAIETLLPLANNDVLLRFMEVFKEELRPLCSNPFSSHVLQKLIVVATEKALTFHSNDGTETCKYTDWVLAVSRFLLNNLEEQIWDTYANHVIRTSIESIGGIRSGTGSKWTVEEKLVKEVPEDFKSLLIEYGKKILSWPQLPELSHNDLTSGFLQTLLLALKACETKLTKKLLKRLLDECFDVNSMNIEDTSCSEEAKKKNLEESASIPDMFYSEPMTRLLDVALAVSSSKLFTQIYARCFMNRLSILSCEPMANFCVQNLLNKCNEKLEFEAMFDEVAANLPQILEGKKTGVILSMAQGCKRFQTKQGSFLKNLQTALDCSEPEARQIYFVPLVLKLTKYNAWEADKESFQIQLHGSLLLQTMLQFNKPIKVINSLLEMNGNDLQTLFCNPKGSHVMDVFMSSQYVGEKSRDRMVRKLQGCYVALACSKHGSRSLDAIWNAASLKQRIIVMSELSNREALINSSEFGSIIASKYGLSLYCHRPDDWKDALGKEQRKRNLFADIIGEIKPSKKQKTK